MARSWYVRIEVCRWCFQVFRLEIVEIEIANIAGVRGYVRDGRTNELHPASGFNQVAAANIYERNTGLRWTVTLVLSCGRNGKTLVDK